MKEYTVPVVLTISGWVSIKAKDAEEASLKAKALNELGVDADEINDPTTSCEVMVEEIEGK